MLSQAGREVLIKSVVQSIPVYCMSVFLLPNSIEDEIQKMMNSFWWGSKKGEKQGINWLRWEKLTMRNEWGGMGFRDLHAFNLAMLGKQGWKLLTNPDAVVSRVFKAKYFPRGDFLGAAIGHNPSYVWRSIWSSRILLKEGYRWKIGNGISINVWNNSWLRCVDEPFLKSVPTVVNAGFTVSNLINQETGTWNIPVIQTMLVPRDVEEIKGIPLMNLHAMDSIIWRYDKKGTYSVKSAYRVCMERIADLEHLKVDGEWSKIWSPPVPPKIRTFLWRLARNCLPNRSVLRSRGVSCTKHCVCCNELFENNWHVFFQCSKSIECWQHLQMWDSIQQLTNHADGFVEVFFKICRIFDQNKLAKFGMCLWSLWKKRNVRFWEGHEETMQQVITRADELLLNWRVARGHSSSAKQPVAADNQPATAASNHAHRWQPPLENVFKCNVDAAVFGAAKQIGIGACIRDAAGQFVCAYTSWCESQMSAKEAEAWSLYQVLHWLNSMNFPSVIIEMDCKQIVKDVRNNKPDLTEYGSLISECKARLSILNNCKVVFARRQANGSVHALARVSTCYATRSAFNYIPNCILDIIINEMP